MDGCMDGQLCVCTHGMHVRIVVMIQWMPLGFCCCIWMAGQSFMSWLKELVGRASTEWTHTWIDGRTDGWMRWDGCAGRREGWVELWTDRMDGFSAWLDGQMDGRNGWLNIWMNVRTD